MSIPVRMPLPEQLAHTQSNLMAYCPYDYANGYNIAILRHLSAYKQMREELIALFSYVIAHATRPEDMEYVWFLRNICPHNFHELVPKLVEDCLNVLEERTAETTQKHDRDPALERIIIEERLPDTTLRYVKYLQHPSYKLLRISHQASTRRRCHCIARPAKRNVARSPTSCRQHVGIWPYQTNIVTI